MRKIIFIGRSEAGKTTLTQALKGETITYHKTQYVNNFDVIIDTPGEYAQTKNLGHALALYTYEADVVGADGMSSKERKAYELNDRGKASIKIISEYEFLSLLHGKEVNSNE